MKTNRVSRPNSLRNNDVACIPEGGRAEIYCSKDETLNSGNYRAFKVGAEKGLSPAVVPSASNCSPARYTSAIGWTTRSFSGGEGTAILDTYCKKNVREGRMPAVLSGADSKARHIAARNHAHQ
jgi:hypothetical protein